MNDKVETVESLSAEDTLKALLGEQANIMDTLMRDNVELLAFVRMIMSDEQIVARLTESNVMAITTNMLDRIAKDHEEKGIINAS